MQQNVQAQNKASTQPATACAPLPQGKFFNEFEGLMFSREQDKAYQKIQAARNKRFAALSKTYREVESPDGGFIIVYKPGTGDKKMNEIVNAEQSLLRARVPNAQVRRLLTQRYGRYAEFPRAKNLVFTPEQIATGQKVWRDFEAQVIAILTPEQQKTYQANLVVLRGIEACDKPSPSRLSMFSN